MSSSYHYRSLNRAVRVARDEGIIRPEDEGTVALARELARYLDELMTPQGATLDGVPTQLPSPRNVVEVSGRYLTVLRDLGLTPQARAKLGPDDAAELDPLLATVAELRADERRTS